MKKFCVGHMAAPFCFFCPLIEVDSYENYAHKYSPVNNQIGRAHV